MLYTCFCFIDENSKDALIRWSLLIEKYDEEHNTFCDADPTELLKYLMNEHKMKAVD